MDLEIALRFIAKITVSHETINDISVQSKAAADDLVQLLEPKVSGVLTEALSAHVQVILPDHSVAIAASTAASGALSVLPWATVPNVIVTHVEALGGLNSLVEVNQAILAWS